jgi:cell division protein FtsW (lipid II flippase)
VTFSATIPRGIVSFHEYTNRFPWLLMLVVLVLAGLGIAGIYAVTAGQGDISFWDTLAAKQLLWLIVALVVFLLALIPSYTQLARLSYWFYGLSLAVLVLMAVVRGMGGYTAGATYPAYDIRAWIHPIHGAYSWIVVPGAGINFQPSELMKITFIMALAYYLRYRKNFRTWKGLLIPFGLALVPTAFILYASDLGTAMLFLPALFLMLFAAGARPRHLLIVLLAGLVMVPVFYSSLKGYQRSRIDSWLLQSCAERLHFAIRESQAQPADAEPAAEPGAEPATRPARIAMALTDERKTELAAQITAMWRFRLWRLASAISWAKDSPEIEAGRARLFKALDDPTGADGRPLPEARTGPHRFDALRVFFGSMLNDAGHQQFQAEIAAGAGGVLGQGWREGTQTKYHKLVEAHTDFLFPTLAEQFGFVGAVGIIILYGLLLALGIDVSFSTTEPFGRLFVVGVVALLAGQGFLNIAMSIGLMPVTGIPLPLMSYGGSSLLSSFLALGLLCNVALRRLFLIAPRPFEWRE